MKDNLECTPEGLHYDENFFNYMFMKNYTKIGDIIYYLFFEGQ